MALKSTVYKLTVNIADLDRPYYAVHHLTLARHPSETPERLMVRVLAFVCYASDELSFTKGLSEVEEPDLWQKDCTGGIELWIDVGQPDETRIRKACQRAQQVAVLAYSHHSSIWWQQSAAKLTRFHNLQVWQLAATTSQALSQFAERNMDFQVTIQERQIWFSNAQHTLQFELTALKRD